MAAGDVLDETATSAPHLPVAGETLRAGAQIGRYVVERTLGAGGMGIVYAAHDPDLDRRLAVKVLRGDASGESRTRLLREARAMAKVSHPNVITVYEVGSAGGIDFVAMELIEGGSLADWLRGGHRPHREVLRIFRAAGRGLAAAHARGLVHRDFKPGNVLLGPGGKVVVTDFGLARGFEADALATTMLPSVSPPARSATPRPALALDETLAASDSTSRKARLDSADLSSTLTRTGAVLGTPAYMAPEQFAGDSVGPAADQFSFAVALWEALVGARPFRGATIDELRTAVGKPPAEAGKLPRPLRAIVLRALARTPSQRWRDLDSMLDAIDRTEKKSRWLAIGAASVAVGAGLLVLASGRNHATTTRPVVAACALADDELTAAWSPAIAERVDAHFADAPDWTRMRDLMDDFGTQWRSERAATCAAPSAREYHGRLACLASMRDELSAAVTIVERMPAEALRGPGLAELIPRPASCRSGRRAAMTALPDDLALRAQLSEIVRDGALARFTARAGDPDSAAEAVKAADATLAKARALSYPPALAIALEARASIAHAAGDCAAAMPFYEETATVAEAAGADGMRAMARIGQVECAISESSDLAHVKQYAGQADAAILRAGDDPILRAALDTTLARIDAQTGDLARAIERTAKARATFLANHDPRRAAQALSAEAGYRLLRAGPGDEDESRKLSRAAFEQVVLAFGDGHPLTEGARLELGLRLIDTAPDEARAMIALAVSRRPVPPPPPDAIHVRGTIRGPDGAVPSGAKVYAGRMLIATSDGEPLSFEQSAFASAAVGPDGSFDLLTVPLALVYATAPGLASPLTHAKGAAPLALRLVPSGAVEVTTTSLHPTAPVGVERSAELGAQVAEMGVALIKFGRATVYQSLARRGGPVSWHFDSAPTGPMRASFLANSALGDSIVGGVDFDVKSGTTTTVALEVELRGQVIDVIVRADRAASIPTAQVIAFDARVARLPRTNAEVYETFSRYPRMHLANAAPIVDATRTVAGTALYQPDDIHARLAAVQPGLVTICVLPLSGDVRDSSFMRLLAGAEDLEMRCTVVEVTAAAAVQAFVVETPPMKRRPSVPTVPAPPPAPPPPPGP